VLSILASWVAVFLLEIESPTGIGLFETGSSMICTFLAVHNSSNKGRMSVPRKMGMM
jgi:hypothetical protein